jgi:hypothetical protein
MTWTFFSRPLTDSWVKLVLADSHGRFEATEWKISAARSILGSVNENSQCRLTFLMYTRKARPILGTIQNGTQEAAEKTSNLSARFSRMGLNFES